MQTYRVTAPVGDNSIAMLTAVSAVLCYMKDGNEVSGRIRYNRAGTGRIVMWLVDKSVDVTVGQVRNCYFY